MTSTSSSAIRSEEYGRPSQATSSASDVSAETSGTKGPGALVKGGLGGSLATLTDIIATLHLMGRALYIEVTASAGMRLDGKNQPRAVRDAGEPLEDQLAFMDTMASAGALVGIVWSLSKRSVSNFLSIESAVGAGRF